MDAYTGEALRPYVIESLQCDYKGKNNWADVEDWDFNTEEEARAQVQGQPGIFRILYCDNWESLHSPTIIVATIENVD